jgi:hypothetical protein
LLGQRTFCVRCVQSKLELDPPLAMARVVDRGNRQVFCTLAFRLRELRDRVAAVKRAVMATSPINSPVRNR